MNENLEMLTHIYKTCEMGHKSSENLLESLKNKDNKIKNIVESICKSYEHYQKESKKILKSYKKDPKGTGIMANIMSKMNIEKEVMNDNSDASIADMLIQGLTMGNLEIDKRISNYDKIIDKKIMNLAKSLKKESDEYILELKKYL